MKSPFRKHLSAPALIKTVFKEFAKIPDNTIFNREPSISLTDHLMSGLAVFGLKCPSLLAYERQRQETATDKNLKDLYYVNKAPCDTYLRERLDSVDPKYLRSSFKKLFTSFQRGKGLEDYEYLDGHVLFSGDGTGHFRREHPHLKAIFLQDGLASNAPNIVLLKESNLRFIIIAKPGDHHFLFEQLESSERSEYHEIQSEDGCHHQFYFLNNVSLNKSRADIKVNVLEYRYTDKKGKVVNFS